MGHTARVTGTASGAPEGLQQHSSLGALGFHSSAGGKLGLGGVITRGKLSVHSPLNGVDVKDAQKKKKPQVQGPQTQGVSKLKTSVRIYISQTQLT